MNPPYADRGYDHVECDAALTSHGYSARIARRSGGWFAPGDEEPPPPRQYRGTRWVVERTIAWLSKGRAPLVRYEKRAVDHLGFVKLACILLWYRWARRQTG